jgi:NDP-sugar pyrophosphorylase family protein
VAIDEPSPRTRETGGLSHAMILTAGLGTRLHPLTMVRAKPAVPVAGEPIIRRIARWLAGHGVTEIVCNLHHRPETIAAVLGDGSDLAVRVRYSWEQPLVLGTAGGPRQARPIVGADTFLLVNGDTLTDLELAPLLDAHRRTGARVTLALVPHHEPPRYGGVRLDGEGRFAGVAPRGDTNGSWHFIGVQVVSADVYQSLPAGQPAHSIGGLYDELARNDRGAVRGYISEAMSWDIGSVSEYWTTSWAFIDTEGTHASAHGDRVRIDPTARVSHSILWDDVEVSRDAWVEDCIVTDGVIVPAGARYRAAILVRGNDDQRGGAPVSVFPLSM